MKQRKKKQPTEQRAKKQQRKNTLFNEVLREDHHHLVLPEGYTRKQYLRDRAKAVDHQIARMKELGTEAVTLCENLRCRDADRLKLVVIAFLKKHDSRVAIEDIASVSATRMFNLDGVSPQRTFLIKSVIEQDDGRQDDWMLGAIKLSPVSDERFEFSLTRFGCDFPDLFPDQMSRNMSNELFDALAQMLRVEYGTKGHGRPVLLRDDVIERLAKAQASEELRQSDHTLTLKERARQVGWVKSTKLLEDAINRLKKADGRTLREVRDYREKKRRMEKKK